MSSNMSLPLKSDLDAWQNEILHHARVRASIIRAQAIAAFYQEQLEQAMEREKSRAFFEGYYPGKNNTLDK